ncbi:MAG TPA: hypothetical protein VKA91_04355, partial [Nitrososphaeraceae archaeon]|nr:hypothetical protein [Nitrososphaeraceae archaeon]
MSKVEKINLKYLDTPDHLLAKMLIENTSNGIETVLEITPRFFSTWDLAKPGTEGIHTYVRTYIYVIFVFCQVHRCNQVLSIRIQKSLI